MTPDSVLIELLERIGANNGEPICVKNQELNEWPADLVCAMKASGLITQTSPAKSTICLGCERSCSMPVNMLNQAQAVVFCDKRSDINRVSIPLSHIERWQASGYLLAKLIAKLLDLPIPDDSSNLIGWEIGIMRGLKHSSHLTLTLDITLLIQSTGHQFSLIELISFAKGSFKIDKPKIVQAVDKPATAAGSIESAAQRRKRIQKRANTLANHGHKNFIQIVANEEGITPRRIHQLLDNKEA